MLIRSRLVFVVGICFRMFGSGFADRFLRGSLTSLVLLVWFGEEWNTSVTKSQTSRAGNASMRDPASRQIAPASVDLCANLYAPMLGFRKCTEFYLMSTSSPQGLLQNQSVEIILVCIVVLCSPHNNIACIHMCDEYKISNAPNVCHKLLSISFPHEQVCSQTMKYQVYQYVPNVDMSEQFVSKLWRILQLIQFLLL